MKQKRLTVLSILLFCTGLFLLIYPSLSSYLNSLKQEKMIDIYVENVNSEQERYAVLWEEAEQYNQEIAEIGIQWRLSDEEKEACEELLKTDSSNLISYIEIPSISCYLPIYHGTEEAVLQIGIGHITGTSLPVGGESTHCVLSGHRGLPSAKLFTDIDQLVIGDIFYLHTLDRTLEYEVDQISIVEPTDFSKLQIEEGEDYCTLVTCTPYGINTHRLLVRGHRIESTE